MKRIFAIAICLVMLFLTGCRQEVPNATENTTVPTEAVPTTQAPTTEPPIETEPPLTEPPAPETVPGTALADRTVVVMTTVDRDAVLEIVDEFDEEHYVVKTEQGYGLIEKRLVRMDGAEAYEQWGGYARYGAKLYDNYHLISAGAQELNKNTQVVIVDSLGDCLVVQLEETIGYMLESELSRSYIKSTPSGGGGSGGADGGDISLGHQGGVTLLSTFGPQEGEASGSAVVLANGAEIILGWFDRGETVEIVNEAGFAEEKDGWHAVYLDGLYGYVRQNLIAMEGAEPYAEWDGYARYQAVVYDNYYLSGEPVSTLSSNTVVHVICDLGECYLVTIGEETGYMSKEQVSETFIVYSGGGSSGSGGGEWSDPVL